MGSNDTKTSDPGGSKSLQVTGKPSCHSILESMYPEGLITAYSICRRSIWLCSLVVRYALEWCYARLLLFPMKGPRVETSSTICFPNTRDTV